MPQIVPSFLFAAESLEAAEFYVSIFPNSNITNVSYYSEAGPMPAGTVLLVAFNLGGQDYTAINSGLRSSSMSPSRSRSIASIRTRSTTTGSDLAMVAKRAGVAG